MNPCKLVNTNTMAVGLYRGQLESHAMRRPLIRAGSRSAPVPTTLRGLVATTSGNIAQLEPSEAPRPGVNPMNRIYKLAATSL